MEKVVFKNKITESESLESSNSSSNIFDSYTAYQHLLDDQI